MALAGVRLLTTGPKFLVKKYSPPVPPSAATRRRYAPATSGWYWMNSLRPSGWTTPDATSAPDGSYSSMCGLRALANSPVPSAGVLVSNRNGLAGLVTLIEYQSSLGGDTRSNRVIRPKGRLSLAVKPTNPEGPSASNS